MANKILFVGLLSAFSVGADRVNHEPEDDQEEFFGVSPSGNIVKRHSSIDSFVESFIDAAHDAPSKPQASVDSFVQTAANASTHVELQDKASSAAKTRAKAAELESTVEELKAAVAEKEAALASAQVELASLKESASGEASASASSDVQPQEKGLPSTDPIKQLSHVDSFVEVIDEDDASHDAQSHGQGLPSTAPIKKHVTAESFVESSANTSTGVPSALNTQLAISPYLERLELQIRARVFKNGKLNIPEHYRAGIASTLNTKCMMESEYTLRTVAMDQAQWQCEDKNHVFEPDMNIKALLDHAVGWPKESAGSASSTGTKWCGNPSIRESLISKMSSNANVMQYWEGVKKGGGFFNVLACNDPNTYAVIGVAGINGGQCYPVHGHSNQEVYWEVSQKGSGDWKVWPGSGPVAQDLSKPPNVGVAESDGGLGVHIHLTNHYHEMISHTGMLQWYWWAMQRTSQVKDLMKDHEFGAANLYHVGEKQPAQGGGVAEGSCFHKYCHKCNEGK